MLLLIISVFVNKRFNYRSTFIDQYQLHEAILLDVKSVETGTVLFFTVLSAAHTDPVYVAVNIIIVCDVVHSLINVTLINVKVVDV